MPLTVRMGLLLAVMPMRFYGLCKRHNSLLLTAIRFAQLTGNRALRH